jgi:phenylacetate-CoA ligase
MRNSTISPRDLAAELITHTRWSADQLAAHQQERLQALLRHAITVSPFYRRRFGSDLTGARLEELPTLSKTELMAHFDEIVTDPRLRRSAVQTHLAGPAATEPLHDHLVLSTSGSTGEPASFVCTREELAPWTAALMRTMTLFGVAPGMRMAGLGSPSGMHISRHLVAGLLAGQAAAGPRTSAATPIPEVVEAFNAYRPDAVLGYTSLLALVADEQLAGRLHIAPRVVAYAGEVLTSEMRARIREAWGIEPVSMYSTTEAGMLASGCPADVGMHLWEDLSLVEVVDEHDRPVPPGAQGHHILLTNLVNRTQPLIRYEITDLVTLAVGPDPAGTPFRRIADIGGRSDDIAHLPALAGGAVAVLPNHLRAPVATVPGLRQYQIIAGADHVRIAVVLRNDAHPDTPRRVQAALHCALLDAGVAPPPITVTPIEGIPREPGPSGKFKTVKVA